MISCWILDDQYWLKIYNSLSKILSKLEYPIKNNIDNPISIVDEIQNWDIILLDNYFPWNDWEEPLWEKFLEEYTRKWLSCKIICISDYGKVLLDRYTYWDEVYNKWDIIWFVPNKDPNEIINIIKKTD